MNDCQGRSRFKYAVHGTNALNEDIEMLINRTVDNLDLENKMIANNTAGSLCTYIRNKYMGAKTVKEMSVKHKLKF